MRVMVETYVGYDGVEMPRRFHFDSREIEVTENIDRWPGPDYCYFQVKDSDGNTYILRHDQRRAEWELTLFQSGQAGLNSLKG